MTEIIDFRAALAEREKLTIAVAGLVAENCAHPTDENVATFAFEVRRWNETRPDMFYADVLATMSHDSALAWATEFLSAIPQWRDALFGEAR
ncbi:hypothetical protein A1351_11320 [Methylosinus sp. R-45379]|uniref:hypothetical protein n=1 Tax=Methylosinus sp. R-45379 TaxID=980563 RepID=UPI0007C9106C|nr:hypothetical protein [Methylosinus sp. R-45379]OAI28687.1 hypothetical protein A1351_11320 [Methylosinus sp. R-45379]